MTALSNTINSSSFKTILFCNTLTNSVFNLLIKSTFTHTHKYKQDTGFYDAHVNYPSYSKS